MSGPRPITDADSITEEWWQATREARLVLQTCRECNNFQHYPKAVCTNCGSTELEYAKASGRGEVYSFTVIYRAPDPAFDPPYVVGLIRLSEGPVLLSNIVGVKPEEVRCDMTVEVAWEDLPDGRKLPVFTVPAEGE
jgi:uncharacterized OB-fold protein